MITSLGGVFDAMGAAYCLVEATFGAEGETVDCRVLALNEAFVAVTGLSHDGGDEVDASPARRWVAAVVGRATATGGGPVQSEAAADGRMLDVHVIGCDRPEVFALVARDQKRAPASVIDQRFLAEMTALVPDLLEVYDLRQGRTVFANRDPREVLGRAGSAGSADGDVTPTTDGAITHLEDLTRLAKHQAACLRLGDGEIATVEYRVTRPDGGWRWLSRREAVLERDADGAPSRLLRLIGDVTERKAAESTLRARAAADAYLARLVETMRDVNDPVQVQAQAARMLGEHLAASRVHYAEIDELGRVGVVAADYHRGVGSVVGEHHLDDHGAELMNDFRAGLPIIVHDVARDARLNNVTRTASLGLGIGAYVMVPLIKKGQAVAALVVHQAQARTWSSEEVALVADTAERTWMAVTAARRERASRQRQQRAELMAALFGALEDEPDVQRQLQVLADLLVPVFADYVTVEVPEWSEYLPALAHRDPAMVEVLRELRRFRLASHEPNSITRAAAGQSQLISEVPADMIDRYDVPPEAVRLHRLLSPRSHMAVPLDIGGTKAAIMVGLVDPDRPPYVELDLAFLEALSQRIGILLAAARIRRQEHDIAVRLQRALLPDDVVYDERLPIAARYDAAGDLLQVGGDWYDTFRWPDGRIGLIVGDVMGHDLDSAAAMGRLRAATAALVAHVPSSPAAVLDALEGFARGPNGTEFATAVCLVLDPATGRLTYTSAGHPPLLVMQPGAPPVFLDDALSPPLCAQPTPSGHPRPETAIDLAPGALAVIYSDGVIERRHEQITVGLARLLDVVGSCGHEPLDVVADLIVAGCAAESPAVDDVVVLCCRFCPEVACSVV